MANYFITKKANQDLNAIWGYTYETWSEEQADKYYHLIIDTFHKLSVNPELGRPYSTVARSLFGFKVNRHIIFYRTLENTRIEITRILHERMDLKTRLFE